MPSSFDIRLESLAAGGVRPAAAPAVVGASGNGKSFFIETFGCQMNDHDSEKVAGVLLSRGYRRVEDSGLADLVFFNTCSIREKASQKVFSRLGTFTGAARREKIIGVLGCVAQQEGEEIFERAPWVSLVCGSASYPRLPELLEQLEAGQRRVMGLGLDATETFETELTRRDNPFRAYLTIIEGCDKACSYCVVPRTRGPERSRHSSAILEELHRLAEWGYSEVQLLGQTVNSYRDPGAAGMNFVGLLRAAAAVPGIRRIRFTTSHPNDFSPEIVEAIDELPVLCDHVHLPVQSGSTRLLRSMARTYTREEYLERIGWIRSARRPISITTDIIVGFPGETEEDFQETLSLLGAVGFDGVFSFKYSPRPGTPALGFADHIPEPEQSRRLAALQQYQREIQMERNEKLAGKMFEVLVDTRHESRNQWAGKTTSHRVIHFAEPLPELLGKYVLVRVTGAGPNSLAGEFVREVHLAAGSSGVKEGTWKSR